MNRIPVFKGGKPVELLDVTPDSRSGYKLRGILTMKGKPVEVREEVQIRVNQLLLDYGNAPSDTIFRADRNLRNREAADLVAKYLGATSGAVMEILRETSLAARISPQLADTERRWSLLYPDEKTCTVVCHQARKGLPRTRSVERQIDSYSRLSIKQVRMVDVSREGKKLHAEQHTRDHGAEMREVMDRFPVQKTVQVSPEDGEKMPYPDFLEQFYATLRDLALPRFDTKMLAIFNRDADYFWGRFFKSESPKEVQHAVVEKIRPPGGMEKRDGDPLTYFRAQATLIPRFSHQGDPVHVPFSLVVQTEKISPKNRPPELPDFRLLIESPNLSKTDFRPESAIRTIEESTMPVEKSTIRISPHIYGAKGFGRSY